MTPEIIEKEEYSLGEENILLYADKVIYLTIHSMLHLTDLDHGEEMDNLEMKANGSYLIIKK